METLKALSPAIVLGSFGAAVAYHFTYHEGYERYFHVEPGDLVVDAGPSEGSFCIPACSKARKVIAIEPHPQYASYLRSLRIPNLEVVQKAVWSHPGVLYLTLRGRESSILATTGSKVQVDVDTIDNILKGTPVDFLKMDVEGAEVEALLGAKNTLLNTRKVAVAAYHRRPDLGLPRTYLWVEPYLRNLGFRTKVGWAGLTGNGIVYGIKHFI